MKLMWRIKRKVDNVLKVNHERRSPNYYYKRYIKYSFSYKYCHNEQQYEASITRLYHMLEKGLAYLDYRPGFGRDNVEMLILLLGQYSKSYDINKFFYRTALSVLNEYIRKNKEYDYDDNELSKRVASLPGIPNDFGGTIKFTPLTRKQLDEANFRDISINRHSVRHFSQEPLDLKVVKDAIELAQHAPSACNRQGGHAYIINNKEVLKEILRNQNGNRGFGQEFDKLIVVVGDLRYFSRDRELYQVFIDGGMYAMRILDSLFYEGIASVPLSASLTKSQEENVRRILSLDDAEELIMFIGIGNYPEVCQTARSERKPAQIKVF